MLVSIVVLSQFRFCFGLSPPAYLLAVSMSCPGYRVDTASLALTVLALGLDVSMFLATRRCSLTALG